MVTPAEIDSAAERLKQRLAPAIQIEKILLFGSHGRGDARPDSDVDLIVVSPSFRGKSLGQRAHALHHAWDLDAAVDFLCYTPEEFARLASRTSIVQIALDEGRELIA